MTQFAYRQLEPTPEARDRFCRWIKSLDEYFVRHRDPKARAEKVRDELHQLFLAKPRAALSKSTLSDDLPATVLELSLNPQNITLEPEYYGDVDVEKYNERKPLIWLWQMFDRSPVALNHWLGFRFRLMLARHIFKHVGKNVKIFHGVEFTYGYNLTIEDDCTIHKFVMLDDRGPLTIRRGTSISDYTNVYTHTHDVLTQADVTMKPVEIGPRARLTYHSTVLAGASVPENALLAAMGLATRTLDRDAVSGGVPARKIKDKPEQPDDGLTISPEGHDAAAAEDPLDSCTATPRESV